MPPETTEARVDQLLWRVGQVAGLVVLLGEVAWLVDASHGHRYSQAAKLRVARWVRAATSAWTRVTAPSRARAEAPYVVWEAMQAMETDHE